MFNNSFDNTYKECLKENILADFSSGFQKGLEKSEKGMAPWQKEKDDPKEDKEDKNKKNENYIGFQNIPKVGEKILFPLKNGKYIKAFPLKNGKYIKAKVLTSINQKGQWEIELLNDKNSADPLYYYTSDVYPDGVITTPIYMKSKHTTPQQINSVEGPYKDCIVGFNTPYSKWLKEKDTLQNY